MLIYYKKIFTLHEIVKKEVKMEHTLLYNCFLNKFFKDHKHEYNLIEMKKDA